MEIKVLGTGCAGCKALHETVKQAVAELGLAATVVKEEDIVKIMSYNVMTLPAVIGLSACGNNSRNTPTDTPQSDCVEVLCFHGAKRCATCIAIENGVKEVIETDFAAQVAAGEVRFRMIDIAKSENEALADKYEVAWSSLLLNRWRDGRETVTDLTKFAFANVRTNPKKFKAELRAEIQRQIDE